ncbi:MAG: ABC-type nickel/cobalt efflux system permease component RcnA [Oleiphilaceae bacterium]
MLIYAHLVGVYGYGVAATLLMGVGIGLSVSLMAIATLYTRSLLERLASDTGAKRFFFGYCVKLLYPPPRRCRFSVIGVELL